MASLRHGERLERVREGRIDREAPMKAWIFRRYGGPEVLEWADVPEPVAGKGEIVVRVVASALNPLDWKLRAGMFKIVTAGRLPRGVGYDYAGVVESVGRGTSRLRPGDAVVGVVNPVQSRNAAMAERVCAPEALATVKPASLSFTDGASLPGAGITAVQALRDANLAAGKRVLVVGAAGGVGSFAVQIARDAGANVTAVASTAGQGFLATLKPDRVIDYRREDWKALPERFDIVLDASGTSTFPECRRLLAPGGAFVHTLPNAALYGWSWWLRMTAKERCVPVMERPNLADLQALVRLASEGRIGSVVTRVASPGEVPALQQEMQGGHAHGKFVVRFAPDPA
jgi:NADPH:quinone reductase-like Zn-dependent oxidoreductase